MTSPGKKWKCDYCGAIDLAVVVSQGTRQPNPSTPERVFWACIDCHQPGKIAGGE